jgi:hypothetical protein
MEKFICFVFAIFSLIFSVSAQGYLAVHGSSYAGSLGIGNNPASITSTPYTWDIDLISLQGMTTSNAYTVNDYSLLTSVKNTYSAVNDGNYKRYGDLDFNLNLLNARISLNPWQAIAFGINLRGNSRAKTGIYNYTDTLLTTNQFLGLNQTNQGLGGDFSSSTWIELFATYSQTLWDDNQGRLNGGITLKAMRGISGAFAQLNNLGSEPTPNGPDSSYTLVSGSGRYGYSYNYDGWNSDKSNTQNLKDFLNNTRGGFSMDLGFEYFIKSQGVSIGTEADNYYDYDWKIGVSLLDWGYNQYKYGNKSRSFTGPANNITGAIVNQKFDSITNFGDATDSLESITSGFSAINGKFKVENPTRLVINIDKPLQNDFYINADISLNFHNEEIGARRFYTQELNLVTVTPRWETRKWGIYLPIQYNMEKNFWVGGAFKIGPLLIGLHNWAYFFSKNKVQRGGGYLALVLRSPADNHAKTDKQLDCPK